MDPWEATKPARAAFADYLATLTPADWAAQSWCDQWTVKDVAAHLLVPPTVSAGKVFFSFVAAGFNLHKMNAKYVAKLNQMTPEQIVATTRSAAGSRNAPPGLPPIGVFGEVVVHSTDIARAIDKPFALPSEHYVMALDYYKNFKDAVLASKQRIEGVHLRATDTTWSTGDGPLVEGPADLLLAAMTGRRAALTSLTGPGVEVLADRFAHR
jgi:uncharacterized protein (TIGR03083 family)